MSLMGRTLSRAYNCSHFLADAWEDATGQDIRPVLCGFFAPVGERVASSSLVRDLRRISARQDPCIVLFRRGIATPHVGLFIRGRVLHLTDSGPIRQLLPVAALGYSSVRFYVPR